MNPYFGLDLARSRQQDLVRDANHHRRDPRKRRGLISNNPRGESHDRQPK